MLFILLFTLPVRVMIADIGPKPSMKFDFDQDLDWEQVPILLGYYMSVISPIAAMLRRSKNWDRLRFIDAVLLRLSMNLARFRLDSFCRRKAGNC